MTSSLRITCSGSNHFAGGICSQKRCDVNKAPMCSVAIGNWTRSTIVKGRMTAVAMTTVKARGQENQNRMIVEQIGKTGGGRTEGAAHEKLDRWMRESVVEIVKNLNEAPLLVQVYSKREGETTLATVKEVVVEDWEAVKDRWEVEEMIFLTIVSMLLSQS